MDVKQLAQIVSDALANHKDVTSTQVLDDSDVAVEFDDGTEFFVTIEEA